MSRPFKVPGSPHMNCATPDDYNGFKVGLKGYMFEGVSVLREHVNQWVAFYGYDLAEQDRFVADSIAGHEAAVARAAEAQASPNRSPWAPEIKKPPEPDTEGLRRYWHGQLMVDVGRNATRDGLRMMAFMAPFLERGEDPVRLLANLMMQAGYDVTTNPDWIAGLPDEDEDSGLNSEDEA